MQSQGSLWFSSLLGCGKFQFICSHVSSFQKYSLTKAPKVSYDICLSLISFFVIWSSNLEVIAISVKGLIFHAFDKYENLSLTHMWTLCPKWGILRPKYDHLKVESYLTHEFYHLQRSVHFNWPVL